MTIIEKNSKLDGILVAVLQYAYLLFYLNYSNAIINSQVFMIGICVILLIAVFFRFVFTGGSFSLCLLIALFGAVAGFFCAILNGSGLGSAVTQTSFLMAICFSADSNMLKRDYKRVILRMVIFLAAILIVFSARDLHKVYYLPVFGYFDSSVSINPNGIAMLWFFLLIYICKYIELCNVSPKTKGIFTALSVVICMLGIWDTDARTSFIAGLLFVALFVFYKKINFKKLKYIYIFTLILSLGVAFIYAGMYQSGFLIDVTIFGKGFYSGRQNIWIEAIGLIKSNLLIGFSNKTAFTDAGFLSLHNSLLATLSYYGIFILFANLAVMSLSFKKIGNPQNRSAALAVLSAVFIMTFETLTTDWSLMWPLCLLFIHQTDQAEESEICYDT